MAQTPQYGRAHALSGNTVLFIDTRVEGYETLAAARAPGAEVVFLDTNSDGLAQMAGYLAGRSGIDSIQLISHGNRGALQLGSTYLDSESIESYAAELQAIGRSLTVTGDLLLYACNVAQGDAGVSFVGQLATLTSADVAASSDLTGAAARGGDWVLEAASGSIEAGIAVFEEDLVAWGGVLVANTAPTFVLSNGKLTTAIGSGNDVSYSVTLQPDSGILVAGYSSNGTDDDFAAVRYNADGSLDTGFDGDGKLH